ncbi:hypothetical protein PV08_05290 [Exophiala spinifera]|uniref:Xylanolytic transcriptional activator regulatory domain-containing protein n=1 Tax=Exophiala spinifera TaxID=91928 RepID=A0A0D2B9B0_9EURO|nr:uncharacterized protein PV08_05290 [Exophiala spinifera]KIW15245.1 hypothetical protein PV08_05290 [Exophiala spinifera]
MDSTNSNEDAGFANGDDHAEKSITLIVSASTARSLYVRGSIRIVPRGGVKHKQGQGLIDPRIETYFEDVHACFPIIHQPTFRASLPDLLGTGQQQPRLPLDQGLLIYSMMALSSRFSRLPEFRDVPLTQRGRGFAHQSGKIISQLLMESELDKASLTFLHGCSLAAAYWLACAPNGKSWFLVGICVRMAYGLSLHTTDVDLRDSEAQSLTSTEWARRESLRRAWWMVVECDNFASVLRCRPLSIDRSRMHVLLPCNDEFWFSETPCTSAFLDNDAQRSWKDLKCSSNKNPHAWYLLVNQLMIRGHEMSLNSRRSITDQKNLRNLIQAVDMGLPEEFSRTRHSAATFEEGSIDHDNWVVALHLMLQVAHAYIFESEEQEEDEDATLEGEDKSPVSSESGRGNPPHHPFFEGGKRPPLQVAPQKFRPTLNAMLRVIRTWPPDYCINCQPWIVCALIGPQASHLQATFFAPTPSRGALERDLIRETIGRMAKYWDVASVTLELMDTLTSWLSSRLQSDDTTTTATTRSPITDLEPDHKLRCLLPV